MLQTLKHESNSHLCLYCLFIFPDLSLNPLSWSVSNCFSPYWVDANLNIGICVLLLISKTLLFLRKKVTDSRSHMELLFVTKLLLSPTQWARLKSLKGCTNVPHHNVENMIVDAPAQEK